MKNRLLKIRLVLLAVVAILAVSILLTGEEGSGKGVGTASAASENEYASVGMLNEVPENFAFSVKSNALITNFNVGEFVTVTDMEEKAVALKVIERNGFFKIYPKQRYKPGATYRVRLRNAQFEDDTYEDGLLFTIAKAPVRNTEYRDSVKRVPGGAIESIDSVNKEVTLTEGDYDIGDILIIPTLLPNTDKYIDIAYKIQSIDGRRIRFSVPELTEVYSQFEISDTYGAESAVAYDKESIKNQIMQNPEVNSIAHALNDMKGAAGAAVDALAPKQIKIEFISLNPLDVDCLIVWEMTDKLDFCLEFNYKSSTIVDFSADETTKRQVTKHSGIWTIGVEFRGDIMSLDTKDLFKDITTRNKYAKNLYNSYEADSKLADIEKRLKDYSLTDAQRAALELERIAASEKVDYYDLDKKYAALQDKNAAMLTLKTLSDFYKRQMSKSSSEIKFVQLFFPLGPGIACTADVGAVLDFSIGAVMSAKLTITSVNEVGTVTSQNGQADSSNSYYSVSAHIGVNGAAALKVGCKLGVGLTIAGVFNLSLSFEGGLYAEFSALGAILFGDSGNLDLTEEESELFGSVSIGEDKILIAGEIGYDVGAYYFLDFTVSFDLWVLDISKSFEIVGDKTSFIKNAEPVDEIFYELVFADERGADSLDDVIRADNEKLIAGAKYDPTRVFEISNVTGAVQLPAVYIRGINLRTGEVVYTPVDEDELLFVNQDDVYFEGLTCYADDYYAHEIDNRLNLRLVSDKTAEKLLELPIRCIKRPIEVERVIIAFEGGNGNVGLTESRDILVDVLPYTATYGNYAYVMEKIVRPDGSLYTGDLSEYAYIDNNVLFTTKHVEIGSEIYFHAVALHNGVVSNTLKATVVRIAVESVELYNSYRRSDINPGEEMSLSLKIFPLNATVNVLKDVPVNVSLNDATLASLEDMGDGIFHLKAFDIAANTGKKIQITVTVDGIAKTVSFTVNAIPIEAIVIKNQSTGSELDAVTQMTRGATIRLSAIITPVNATVRDWNYNLFSTTPNFGKYISVSDDGILQVAENAPLGMEVLLNVTALRKASNTYKIIIAKRHVDKILLTADHSYIIKGTVICLSSYIYPVNADNVSVRYEIENLPSGVLISGNVIYASGAVESGTILKIKATADNVESNVLTLTVIDDPNVEIVPSEEGGSGGEFVHDSSGGNHLIDETP